MMLGSYRDDKFAVDFEERFLCVSSDRYIDPQGAHKSILYKFRERDWISGNIAKRY